MDRVKKIVINLFLLTVSIFLIGINTLKELMHSVNTRKGNLPSIIFSFLIETVEEIFVFERSILSRSWMLQQNFIKRGLVIAAAFFFLLSSFEWVTGDQQPLSSASTETVQVAQEQTIIAANNNNQSISVLIIADQDLIHEKSEFITQKNLYHQTHLPLKKYLINRSFLI